MFEKDCMNDGADEPRMRIAVFASGEGSNAENIIRYFSREGSGGEVVMVVCNRAGAGVVERCRRLGIECKVMSREELMDGDAVADILLSSGVNLVVLAGYLLLVPASLIRRFEGRMVNIHPSLLPRHGGKGMYGMKVHEAVVAAGDKESGITIHLVNEEFDKGRVLFQARCEVTPTDTPADVCRKVAELEMRHYPEVIASLGKKLYSKR